MLRPSGIPTVEHRRAAQRRIDADGPAAVLRPAPKVDPAVPRQVERAVLLVRQIDRGHQQVAAQQVLRPLRRRARIVLVVQEQRTLDRDAPRRVLAHSLPQIGGQRRVEPRQAAKGRHAVRVVIILEILGGAVALMGPHDRRKGRHLRPA